MITNGPVGVAIGTTSILPDPNVWGVPSARVQVLNSSPYVLNASTSGGPVSIQPFYAVTIFGGFGDDLTVTPMSNPSGIANIGTVSASWLLRNEAPFMPDGQLAVTALVTSVTGTLPGVPSPGGAPTTTLAGTTASVTWTAPASSGSSAITGYSVVPYLGGVPQTAQVFGTATTENIAGLGVGSWTFAVAAITLVGTGSYSAQSNAVVVVVTITEVGQWSEQVGGQATLTVSPANLYDLMICEVQGGTVPSGVTDGGVTGAWTKIGTYALATGGIYISWWWGIVTTTGAGTITLANMGGQTRGIVCTEFATSSGAAQTWALVTTNTSNTPSPSASGTFASVSPTGSGQLYIGASFMGGGGAGGSSAGFVYFQTGTGTSVQVVYNLTPPTPSAPPWTQTLGNWATFSVVMQGT